MSPVFSAMVAGTVITNTQTRAVVEQITDHVSEVTPLLTKYSLEKAGETHPNG